jgi:hypothetical protein
VKRPQSIGSYYHFYCDFYSQKFRVIVTSHSFNSFNGKPLFELTSSPNETSEKAKFVGRYPSFLLLIGRLMLLSFFVRRSRLKINYNNGLSAAVDWKRQNEIFEETDEKAALETTLDSDSTDTEEYNMDMVYQNKYLIHSSKPFRTGESFTFQSPLRSSSMTTQLSDFNTPSSSAPFEVAKTPVDDIFSPDLSHANQLLLVGEVTLLGFCFLFFIVIHLDAVHCETFDLCSLDEIHRE